MEYNQFPFDQIQVVTEKYDNDGNPIYKWVDRPLDKKEEDAFLVELADYYSSCDDVSVLETPHAEVKDTPEEVIVPELINEQYRAHFLMAGLNNMRHGMKAKPVFEKACGYCDSDAKKACSLHVGTCNSAGKLAIKLSTYRQGSVEANRRRNHMNKVLNLIDINTQGVPCETLWQGVSATKKYIKERKPVVANRKNKLWSGVGSKDKKYPYPSPFRSDGTYYDGQNAAAGEKPLE